MARVSRTTEQSASSQSLGGGGRRIDKAHDDGAAAVGSDANEIRAAEIQRRFRGARALSDMAELADFV
jgi:hypothetical protein